MPFRVTVSRRRTGGGGGDGGSFASRLRYFENQLFGTTSGGAFGAASGLRQRRKGIDNRIVPQTAEERSREAAIDRVTGSIRRQQVRVRHEGITARLDTYGAPFLNRLFEQEFTRRFPVHPHGANDLKARVPYRTGRLRDSFFFDRAPGIRFGFDDAFADYADIVRFRRPIKGRRRTGTAVLTYSRSPGFRRLIREARVDAAIAFARASGLDITPAAALRLLREVHRRGSVQVQSGISPGGTGQIAALAAGFAYLAIIVDTNANPGLKVLYREDLEEQERQDELRRSEESFFDSFENFFEQIDEIF